MEKAHSNGTSKVCISLCSFKAPFSSDPAQRYSFHQPFSGGTNGALGRLLWLELRSQHYSQDSVLFPQTSEECVHKSTWLRVLQGTSSHWNQCWRTSVHRAVTPLHKGKAGMVSDYRWPGHRVQPCSFTRNWAPLLLHLLAVTWRHTSLLSLDCMHWYV